MWELTTPWYELVARAGIIYIFLLIIFRIAGKKHLGEMAPFDFILLLIISEATQNALIGEDFSILASAIVVVSLLGIDALFNKLTYYFKPLERIIEGEAVCVIKQGVVNHKVLEKEKISMEELIQSLRVQGVLDVSQVYLAHLETNGKISVIKKEDAKLKGKIKHKLRKWF